MALTFDVTEIENYKENFPDRVVTEEEAASDDPNSFGKSDPPGTYWNPYTEHLVWACLRVGLGEISKENLDEWVRRYETSYSNDGEKPPLNREQIASHIGLRTNISNVTKRSWNAKEKRLASLG